MRLLDRSFAPEVDEQRKRGMSSARTESGYRVEAHAAVLAGRCSRLLSGERSSALVRTTVPTRRCPVARQWSNAHVAFPNAGSSYVSGFALL
jgi:hypothetical protein